MNARISGVATAVPEYAVSQDQARDFAHGFFAEDLPELDRLLRAFGNTGIKRRHLARPPEWYERPHTFAEKNEVYRESALELSATAAEEAIERSGVDRSAIGAILFVSTTGISTPSLDSVLVPRLGLPMSIARVPIWGLGCAGGAAGLARAAALTAGMGKPTLMISAEVCSTTFLYGDRSKSNLIATALFGDGAAAVVLTPDGDGAEVICGHSHLLEDSQDVMGWKLEDEGLRVVFARSIPNIVHDVAGQVAADAAGTAGLRVEDLVHYVFHPGGAKVLSAYVDTLEIDPERLRHARDVLADYGNMSSPTVLFVLERLLAEQAPSGDPGLLMALGPGFSAESVVFRW
jgi:alkylresorcinol/alkylpyrone synthase